MMTYSKRIMVLAAGLCLAASTQNIAAMEQKNNDSFVADVKAKSSKQGLFDSIVTQAKIGSLRALALIVAVLPMAGYCYLLRVSPPIYAKKSAFYSGVLAFIVSVGGATALEEDARAYEREDAKKRESEVV